MSNLTRVIVNVATGPHYVKGQTRLFAGFPDERLKLWRNQMPGPNYPPNNCPEHAARPYAFKAWSIREAALEGAKQILWADACIRPGAAPLQRIWDWTAENGVWLSRNGYTNYEWTAESAYPDLFQDHFSCGSDMATARAANRTIPHVVATAFAVDLDHPTGKEFCENYTWLAMHTEAFTGPWINKAHQDAADMLADGRRVAVCGPPDVRGHRHDQTAASVIAWRLGIPLTEPPHMFAYAGGETADTVLIADGNYA